MLLKKEKMTPIKHFHERKLRGMSIHAEVLLDLIDSLPQPTVMDIIDTSIRMEIATRNTIHQSLMWLKNHSYISITRREEDLRVKLVILTGKGKTYLQKA